MAIYVLPAVSYHFAYYSCSKNIECYTIAFSATTGVSLTNAMRNSETADLPRLALLFLDGFSNGAKWCLVLIR